MGAIPIIIAFHGNWDDNQVYTNYKTSQVEIVQETTIAQFKSSIVTNIKLDENSKVDSIALYKDGSEKQNIMVLTDDRDVHWMYKGFAGGMHTNCCVVVEISTTIKEIYNADISGGLVSVRVGLLFPNRDELQRALCKLALTGSFKFKTLKSNKKQFVARCTHDACNWYVRASVYRGGDLWLVRKFIDTHTCPVDVVGNDHPQATPNIVCEYVEGVICANTKFAWTPGDVIKYAKKNHGVTISYYKAMKGKEKALEQMNGRPEDSYAFLSKFAAKLIEKNPGTYTAQESYDDGRFKYFFMSMGASIRGWKHCRPAISVDGASLKNKFAGTMITACTFDGNSSIYPLAFAIVDSENDNSWEWFFRNLKAVFGEHEDLIIVSDRHSSIQNGFNRVYSTAHQTICVFHLLGNIKPGGRTKAFTDMYFNCVKAYTEDDYEYCLSRLEQMSPNIRRKLEEAEPHRWARVFSLKNRYILMTTNVSESLNNHLVHTRELPVIKLLEEIIDFMQRWFYERRNDANFEHLDISRRCDSILRHHLHNSRTMDVHPVNNNLHAVRHQDHHHEVDLREHTCTCKQWQSDLIPCPHACKAIRYNGLNLDSFVDEFFKTSTLRKLYEGDIHPFGRAYRSLLCRGSSSVQPPNVKRLVGRPRKRRYQSHNEAPTRVRCGRCGRLGHNKRTCRDVPLQ